MGGADTQRPQGSAQAGGLPAPVCAILPSAPAATRSPALLESLVDEALQAGVRWLQCRDKDGDAAARLERLARLRAQVGPAAFLTVNDWLDDALQLGIGGLHLGQGDGDPALARRKLGEGALLGVSCQDSVHRAELALRAGASYVSFGRLFASTTKADAPAIRPDDLRRCAGAVRRLGGRSLAIGGIDPDNAARAWACGVDALAAGAGLLVPGEIAARLRAVLSGQSGGARGAGENGASVPAASAQKSR